MCEGTFCYLTLDFKAKNAHVTKPQMNTLIYKTIE